jgi:formate dehydrogenase subunit gamma
MARARIIKKEDGSVHVERFSPLRRVEHVVAIVTFVTLVVTGFPQRFVEAGWARWLIQAFGGLETARFVHRCAGVVFTAHAVLHIGAIVVGTLSKRMRLTMLPTPRDISDAWQTLRFYLGKREDKPAYPKFDYRQKFEYLGLVLGGLVMISTGLVLMYPAAVATLLPGQVIPASQLAHSNEAMLALLVLVIWHIYGASLSPEVFPLDTTIFTGYLSAEELRERHELEYARLFPEGHSGEHPAASGGEAGSDGGGAGSGEDAGPPQPPARTSPSLVE